MEGEHLEIELLKDKVKSEGWTKNNRKKFWSVVKEVKKLEKIDDKILNTICELRESHFKSTHKFIFPLWVGNVVLIILIIVGMYLFYQTAFQASPIFELPILSRVSIFIWFAIGFILIINSAHPFAHIIIGKPVGISFDGYYFDGRAKLMPTLKINYKSFLLATPKGRARMYASGALETVILSLILAIVASFSQIKGIVVIGWIIALLVLFTDIFLGTRFGEFAKAKNEFKEWF